MDIFDGMTLGDQRLTIQAGAHALALSEFTLRPTREHGKGILARFWIAESSTMTPGAICEKMFFVSGKNSEAELKRLAVFVSALTGLTDLEEVKAAVRNLLSPAQPGRGIVVKCFGEAKTSKNARPYVQANWTHVPQEGADIAKVRAHLDTVAPLAPQAAAVAAVAPVASAVPTAAPAAGPAAGSVLASILSR